MPRLRSSPAVMASASRTRLAVMNTPVPVAILARRYGERQPATCAWITPSGRSGCDPRPPLWRAPGLYSFGYVDLRKQEYKRVTLSHERNSKSCLVLSSSKRGSGLHASDTQGWIEYLVARDVKLQMPRRHGWHDLRFRPRGDGLARSSRRWRTVRCMLLSRRSRQTPPSCTCQASDQAPSCY